ncbi:MAG: HmuY family protein [Emticicia sp.]|nr:HmuY family protein [Emticicia sp.]
MNSNFKISTSILLGMLALASCDKTEEVVKEPVKAETVKDIAANPSDAPSGNKYTFFSFKNGKIANADSATTKWDIGFRSTTIIANGGVSGPGQAANVVKDGIFSEIKEVPAGTVFNMDAATLLGIPTGSGKGWYNYNTSTNIITPIAGKVFLVKTADGKYAKFEVLSYYKGAPANPVGAVGRYYTIRYVYQPDGTTKFE